MDIITLQEFLRVTPAEMACRSLLLRSQIPAFKGSDYDAFKASVWNYFPIIENCIVAGSGNWGFSLNPEKLWSPFGDESDIDLAIVSHRLFYELWTTMRVSHRENWMYMSQEQRDNLRRNGENVYCGFISPKWIIDNTGKFRYRYRLILDKLSDDKVGYRKINMMIFKNQDETISYYSRGIEIAQRKLK